VHVRVGLQKRAVRPAHDGVCRLMHCFQLHLPERDTAYSGQAMGQVTGRYLPLHRYAFGVSSVAIGRVGIKTTGCALHWMTGTGVRPGWEVRNDVELAVTGLAG
jgi:hypothetical protein